MLYRIMWAMGVGTAINAILIAILFWMVLDVQREPTPRTTTTSSASRVPARTPNRDTPDYSATTTARLREQREQQDERDAERAARNRANYTATQIAEAEERVNDRIDRLREQSTAEARLTDLNRRR